MPQFPKGMIIQPGTMLWIPSTPKPKPKTGCPTHTHTWLLRWSMIYGIVTIFLVCHLVRFPNIYKHILETFLLQVCSLFQFIHTKCWIFFEILIGVLMLRANFGIKILIGSLSSCSALKIWFSYIAPQENSLSSKSGKRIVNHFLKDLREAKKLNILEV